MTLEEYYNDLPIGIENSVTREELCKRWRLADGTVRMILAKLCQIDNGDDYIIYSSLNSTPGYFKTDKAYYRQLFLRNNSQRAIAIFSRGAKARRIERDKLPVRDVPNHLSEYRIHLNMSQSDVAKIVTVDKMTAQTLSRYELGQSMPTIAQLQELCALYGCMPQDVYRSNYFTIDETLFMKSP